MASYRDTPPAAKTISHRTSPPSLTMTTLPGRQSHARNSSQSLLTNSLNPNHRVTRRKSVTQPGANITAIAAALRDSENLSSSLPIANPSGRRNTVSKMTAARATIVGSLPSPPGSLPNRGIAGDVKRDMGSSAIDDNNDTSGDEGKTQKARMRRASDGQPLIKEGKKGNRAELRCEKCGKGYKHSSCLAKHKWEHTPEWNYTSKLLISKHQQVQLLEAASVLVAMNGPEKDSSTTPPDSAKDSDQESASSPAASGYSMQADRQSSADTTPPPMSEAFNFNETSYRNKRHDSFSRSYQSAPFTGALSPGSVPRGFRHMRQLSIDQRPTSSGVNNTGEDDRDLAAAVELLSCSFNSNNGSQGTVTLPADAPPVPPLPAQYLDQATSLTNAGFINSFPSRQPESFTRGEFRRGDEDVKMDDQMDSAMDDDDFDRRSRSDEDDDGVFGRMEE